MVERAQRNPKIDFMLDAVVQEIRGDENGVQEVEVRNTATEKTSAIPANGVFMAIGHTPATAFLNGLVDVDSAGYITVDGASTRTSEPGVFAAGDCVDSVYRQATRIIAEGLSVRSTEEIVSMKAAESDQPKKPKASKLNPWAGTPVQVGLEQRFGTKVSIKGSKKHGRIEIVFKSEDDMKRIVDLLMQQQS